MPKKKPQGHKGHLKKVQADGHDNLEDVLSSGIFAPYPSIKATLDWIKLEAKANDLKTMADLFRSLASKMERIEKQGVVPRVFYSKPRNRGKLRLVSSNKEGGV